MATVSTRTYVRRFEELGSGDTALVGGKNASLGEMIRTLKREGVRVPDGFATTADAYRDFLERNRLSDGIREQLRLLSKGERSLQEAGKTIRRMIMDAPFSDDMSEAVRASYARLSRKYGMQDVDVAVRSSATAEDLPKASFAGQQETFLNVRGAEDLLDASKKCFASLFTDRAISYRADRGFDHMKIALSVGVQKMVRADRAGSGVMFSLDTDTGFPDVVVINAAWGLGENVVQGTVNPDEYTVFKPLLDRDGVVPVIGKRRGAKQQKMVYARGGSATTRNVDTSDRERLSYVLEDREILQLAKWAVLIEKKYGRPMDMEWAKDGDSGRLYIVQARPETVQSQKRSGAFTAYRLKERGERLVAGAAIGEAIAAGKARVLKSPDEADRFREGEILVTGMTDPDWVPIMKRAAAIVTDHGGRTSHAAIVSRELGVPAVVGAGNATASLEDGDEVTVSCAEGARGHVYRGVLDYERREIRLEDLPKVKTPVMMNIASPAAAFRWWRLPVRGIGLARMEFVINNIIKIHPMALIYPDAVSDEDDRRVIAERTRGYRHKPDYFVDRLAYGIARIAASRYPDPVLVRMSDFKTNEYAGLVGGKDFEFEESNPMLGFRGAARYYSDRYRAGFALECRAVKRVREKMGFTNVVVMIPFCRTPEEADRVLSVMADNGLRRGENGLEVYVMAEIPSNIALAGEFSDRFDGFSIGSNDLTQMVLGVDRDSEELSYLYDERNEAVRRIIEQLILEAHRKKRKVGICGQGPSDHPDFAEFLVRAGIDSISLNPDSVVDTIRMVAEVEKMRGRGR